MFRLFYWILSNSIKLVFSLFCVVICTMGWLLIDGLNDSSLTAPTTHCDVGVVMGVNVSQIGEPQGGLKERLDKAVELYKLGLFPVIYLVGSERPNQHGISAMGRYLVRQHIPAQAILEEAAEDTDSSAQNVAKACKTHHFQSILLITHYYHMTRAKLSLRHYGVQNIQQVHAGRLQISDWFVIIRDFAAFIFYLIDYEIDPLWAKIPTEVHQIESNLPKHI